MVRRLVHDVAAIHTPIEPGTSPALTNTRIAQSANQSPLDAFLLSNVGEGTKEILALVTGLLLTPAGGTFLVEEPESYLNPGAQRAPMTLFRDHARKTGKQIFITTHSPVFVSWAAGCTPYMVSFGEESGTHVQPIHATEATLFRHELGFRNRDWLFADALIFCKGDSEDAALPLVAEAMGCDFNEEGIVGINIHGTGNVKKLRLPLQFQKASGSGAIVFVIVDQYEGAEQHLGQLQEEGLLELEHCYLWPSQFQGTFSDEQLVAVTNALLTEAGMEGKLDAGELSRKRQEAPGKKVFDLVRELCWEASKGTFELRPRKREFAALLAELAIKESKADGKPLKDCEFGRVLTSTIQIVQTRSRSGASASQKIP